MTLRDTSRPVAVVTGAARGIGLAVARWFLERGHRVALIDRDAPALDAAVAAIGRPDDAIGLHCDVSDEAQVEAAARAVDGAAECVGVGQCPGGAQRGEHLLDDCIAFAGQHGAGFVLLTP